MFIISLINILFFLIISTDVQQKRNQLINIFQRPRNQFASFIWVNRCLGINSYASRLYKIIVRRTSYYDTRSNSQILLTFFDYTAVYFIRLPAIRRLTASNIWAIPVEIFSTPPRCDRTARTKSIDGRFIYFLRCNNIVNTLTTYWCCGYGTRTVIYPSLVF